MKKLISIIICLVILSIAAPVLAENCVLKQGAKVVVLMQDGTWMKGLHPQTIWVQVIRRVDSQEVAGLNPYTGLDWGNSKFVTFGISQADNPEVVQEVFVYVRSVDLSKCQ